jgi:hypothetical protein
MKVVALFALFALCSGAVTEGDRTITKVVKLLQGMLDKSVKEGDAERKIYAKFKCYCDTSEAEKKDSIKKQTELIDLLESKIAEIQGDTGGLSSECADLKAALADNKAARDEAGALRGKENKAFNAEKDDLEQAIKQMKAALETLAAVGGDQTKSTGADNKQFMAGHSSLLQSKVQHALATASALMTPEQQSKATAFLQAPFTGTYTSQSAQVVGIIKSMRDTFKKNLADAIKTEDDAFEAYKAFMTLKLESRKKMKSSYEEKQKALGGNDGTLSTKKKQLDAAKKQKASDEEFMDELVPLCKDKAEAYDIRKVLRANEEAAIAEAISILNSDDAFAAFGKSDATKSGATGFIQLRSVRKHIAGNAHKAQDVLKQAAKEAHSARLTKVAALLQAENAFDQVLGEIDKMLELIEEEGKADKEKFDWCKKERKENKEDLAEKKKEILALEKTIDGLKTDINDPKEGLKVQIAETEQDLVDNTESQKTQTAERSEDNQAYQQDVKNLVAAEGILTKATKVLKVYYDDLEAKLEAGEALLQTKKEDPAPPKSFSNRGYEGQSDKGGDVIGMLDFILKETVKEETAAHESEEKAQADYEDSMTKAKNQEAADEKRLAKLQDDLATAEKDLLEAEEDLKATTENKESIEAYLLKIKPGCDFIKSNFAEREKSRGIEKTALEKAVRLIKGTPAYKTAVNQATVESYGDCDTCEKDKDDVECKACLADVTIPAYCAGHKGTKGC